ncbi:MAG: hypothetical protein FWG26_02505 [Betaproteobacteria bacterium]|jgi:hypothetical protein|nr:hypothetical protein [Betaproteobacteria bacterium]
MAGSVGIFWGIPESRNTWILLIDSTSLEEADPYGDFLTHPRGHYEVWEQWKERHAVPSAGKSVLHTIDCHEYEDFPRGRIVYEVKSKRFIVYADQRLQQKSIVAEIANKFGLPAGAFVVRSDLHYRG